MPGINISLNVSERVGYPLFHFLALSAILELVESGCALPMVELSTCESGSRERPECVHAISTKILAPLTQTCHASLLRHFSYYIIDFFFG